MAASFLQYCATCEKQILVPNHSILYCSQSCRKKDASKAVPRFALPPSPSPTSLPPTPRQQQQRLPSVYPPALVKQDSTTSVLSTSSVPSSIRPSLSSSSSVSSSRAYLRRRRSNHSPANSEAARYLRQFSSPARAALTAATAAASETTRPLSRNLLLHAVHDDPDQDGNSAKTEDEETSDDIALTAKGIPLSSTSSCTNIPSLSHTPTSAFSSAGTTPSMYGIASPLRPLPVRQRPYDSGQCAARSLDLVIPLADMSPTANAVAATVPTATVLPIVGGRLRNTLALSSPALDLLDTQIVMYAKRKAVHAPSAPVHGSLRQLFDPEGARVNSAKASELVTSGQLGGAIL